ncbi:MAG: T9SS type A sorting domain-containing protein [Candidatus Marinimicrobia bacterium]|nr:T9SS type A sorting domain-containing protein [Candidatus Neomarinimicrobiota bacterium]
MKKLILFLTLFILTFNLFGQINLEHSFTGNTPPTAFTTDNGVYYYTFDSESGELIIYNEAFSVYKTVSITMPQDYTYASIINIGDKLINDDSDIEFFLTYTQKVPVSGMVVRSQGFSKLYDENGNLIKDFEENYSIRILSNKLIEKEEDWSVTPHIYTTNIYSLPKSTISNVSFNDTDPDVTPAFPSPSSSNVHLPYSLPNGSSGVMKIFNIRGQLVEKIDLDGNLNHLNLNLHKYTPGIYIYEYNGISNKFTVKP